MNVARDLVLSLAVVLRDYCMIAQTIACETVIKFSLTCTVHLFPLLNVFYMVNTWVRPHLVYPTLVYVKTIFI